MVEEEQVVDETNQNPENVRPQPGGHAEDDREKGERERAEDSVRIAHQPLGARRVGERRRRSMLAGHAGPTTVTKLDRSCRVRVDGPRIRDDILGVKHVVVAIDSAPAAVEVVTAAVDLATPVGATLSLLRVVEGGGEEGLSRARADLRELGREIPVTQLEHLCAVDGVPWEQICLAARTYDADLVALGAHRYGPVERVLGTTVAKVVNHCERAVLVVRGWQRGLRRILLAADDSETSETARGYALELARRTGAKLRLVEILAMPAVLPSESAGRVRHRPDRSRRGCRRGAPRRGAPNST